MRCTSAFASVATVLWCACLIGGCGTSGDSKDGAKSPATQETGAPKGHSKTAEKSVGPILSGSLEAKLVGKYQGEIPQPKSQPGDEQSAKFAAAVGKALSKAFVLELRKDRTFKMKVMLSVDGTWRLDGTTLILTAKSMLGSSLDEAKNDPSAADEKAREMKYKVDAAGKTLTQISGEEGRKDSLVFSKV